MKSQQTTKDSQALAAPPVPAPLFLKGAVGALLLTYILVAVLLWPMRFEMAELLSAVAAKAAAAW